MATEAAVGSSLGTEGYEAGKEAANAALAGLAVASPQLGLVFATARYDQDALLAGVREVLGDALISGCSGEGVIGGSRSWECDHAVTVMAVRSDTLSFETFLVKGYSDDPAVCGEGLARAVARYPDPVALLVFPDGLHGDCTRFLDSLHEALDLPFLIAGGTSADGMQFEQTFQYSTGGVASNSVAAMLIHGRGRMEVAVSHGCTPIGLPRVVTRADGGWLYEIDGRPAWSVFKDYLDGDPDDLNAEGIVHLCIGQPLTDAAAQDYEPYVIRTPLRLEQETGALFFPGGGLSDNTTVQLTRRDPDRIKQSALDCARTIVARRPDDKPAMVFQFDCAGRGQVLFGSCAAEEIVHPLQQALGMNTPWIGFHTYGEIAPIGDQAYYHNYTVALCAVYDVA